MKTQTFVFGLGFERQGLKENKIKGRKILIAEGYTPCQNPLFLQKGKSLVHYNKFAKAWIFDVPPEEKKEDC